MRIFSKHQKRQERKKRFGSLDFRNKLKSAANYKRVFNPGSQFSLKLLPSSNKWIKFSLAALVLLVCVAFYYLVLSSTFVVSAITVTGNHQVLASDIENVITSAGDSRLFFIKKNNLFILTEDSLQKTLSKSLPLIKNITLKKSWPNKISVSINEHTPGFVIESEGEYFLIDDEGAVVEQITDPKKILVVHDQVVENYGSGEILPNQKLAPFILSMTKSWSSKMSNTITSVKFPGKSSNDVQFETSSGWSVLFDTQRSVTKELTDLSAILTHSVKPGDLPNLAYIDLRLTNLAYFCLKQTACEQQPKPTEAAASTKNGP